MRQFAAEKQLNLTCYVQPFLSFEINALVATGVAVVNPVPNMQSADRSEVLTPK